MSSTIAIIGRPNVGKSTLFNRLIGERRAIVNDRPGVTRDRNYGEASFHGRDYILIDTGGFEPDPEDDLFVNVRRQAEVALQESQLLLFVVDRQVGIAPADSMTADMLRRIIPPEHKDRVILLVNKCDGLEHEIEAAEFWQLGFEHLLCISAEHGRGIYDLWEKIADLVPPEEPFVDEDTDEIRIAILGRPNIGKSTLINRLIGEERHVVHDAPGTTMDSIDSVVTIEGQKYRFVDTAGIRRRSKIDDIVERFAVSRAIRCIERCHISMLMIDATQGIAHQDARLAALIEDRGRGCVLLMNRWDLVKDMPERNASVVSDEIQQSLPHLSWAPTLYISALTGKGCHRIMNIVDDIYKQFDQRIPTAKLNRFLEEVVARNPPPQKHHHRVRLNYITQTRVRPPTFVIWANSPEAIKPPYKRYLENRVRDHFGFTGTPIRIQFRKKRRRGDEEET